MKHVLLLFVGMGILGNTVQERKATKSEERIEKENLHIGSTKISLTQSGASAYCKTKGYNLITIRSVKEEIRFQSFLREHDIDTEIVEGGYWLGITRRSKDFEWIYYDNSLVTYNSWDNSFPDPNPFYSCGFIRRHCLKNCTTRWQNRACTQTKDITAVICESRKFQRSNENRSQRETWLLDRVEEQVNSNILANSETTERWIEDIFAAFSDTFVSTAETIQGIRTLLSVAQRDPEIVVSRTAITKVLSTAQIFHDSIKKNLPDFSINQREQVVRTMELFFDRLNLTDSEEKELFNTTDFYAQVQHIDHFRNEGFTFSPDGDQEPTITVPLQAIKRINGTSGAGNRSRIIFMRFRDSLLFPSKHAISQVISAQINGRSITGLSIPVTYSIPLEFEKNGYDAEYGQCAFWNFSTSSWSDEGCFLITKTPSPLCGCNHMTNFALLVQIVRRPSYITYNLISRVIGGLSCVGFFLTAIIYLYFKELRTSTPGPVHINLCSCYGVGYLVFLIGSGQVEKPMSCLAVTILTHFFFLSGWLWTLCEAFTMYQLFVRASANLGEHYHLYTSLVAYILPAAVVGLNVGLTVGYLDLKSPLNGFVRLSDELSLINSAYVSNFACWLTGESLYFGFLAEGGIVFSLNIVFYFLTMRSISWGRKMIRSTRSEASSSESLCRAMIIATMLGLVWLLAIPTELLAIHPSAVEPVTYIFSTLIAVQGIVIFYLLCVRPGKARTLWWNNFIQKRLSILFRSVCSRARNPFSKRGIHEVNHDQRRLKNNKSTTSRSLNLSSIRLVATETEPSNTLVDNSMKTITS